LHHFRGFSSRFTNLHPKLNADTLLSFAIHHRMMSHDRGMQQAYESVTWAFRHIFHWGSYKKNGLGTLRCNLIVC
jgi:hypothetical protein